MLFSPLKKLPGILPCFTVKCKGLCIVLTTARTKSMRERGTTSMNIHHAIFVKSLIQSLKYHLTIESRSNATIRHTPLGTNQNTSHSTHNPSRYYLRSCISKPLHSPDED